MSLLCKIFSHKWNQFIQTGERLTHQNRMSGFGVNSVEEVIVPLGYNKEYEFCKRCGTKNPNYNKENL